MNVKFTKYTCSLFIYPLHINEMEVNSETDYWFMFHQKKKNLHGKRSMDLKLLSNMVCNSSRLSSAMVIREVSYQILWTK